MREEVQFATPGGNGDGAPEPDPTTALLQQLLTKVDRLERQADMRDRPPLRIAKLRNVWILRNLVVDGSNQFGGRAIVLAVAMSSPPSLHKLGNGIA